MKKGFELGFTEKTKKNLWEWYESWKREDGDREESNYVVFFLRKKLNNNNYSLSNDENVVVEKKRFDSEIIYVATSQRVKTRPSLM